jgi:Uma2 family endonuclease
MSIAELQKTTLEELLQSPDRGRYELVHGRLVEVPVGNWANRVAFRLSGVLDAHCNRTGQGEGFSSEQYYRCFGDDFHARKPDASVIRRERLPADWLLGGSFSIPPDLAVEVISINDVAGEIEAKVEEYLDAGVRLIWVIYPETRTAMVYRADGSTERLHADQELVGEDVLPGFQVRLGALLPDALPPDEAHAAPPSP